MYYLNLGFSIILLAGIVFEIYLIFRRNRKILLKGKDDFFTMMLVMLFTMLIFRVTETTSLIESTRNIFLLVFLFASFSIKRGISVNGFEKVFFTIPWREISSIQIEESKINFILVKIKAGKLRYNLLFHSFQLPQVLNEIGNKIEDIRVQESLIEKFKP